MERTGSLNAFDTHVGIWEETVNESDFTRKVYGPIIRHLRQRGFIINKDPYIVRRFPSISNHHHLGKKGSLEVKTKLHGRYIEINFFQNIVFENENGGEYDFNKYDKMPYLIKKEYLLEAIKLIDMLHETFGYEYSKKLSLGGIDVPTYKKLTNAIKGIDPVKEPLKRFNEMWEANRLKRDETGWPASGEYDYGYNKDREGVHLRNGMHRYWRSRDGRLKRGTIYTNMNEMWQLIYGPGRSDTTWVSSRELFSLQPNDCPKRWFPESVRRKKLSSELKKAIMKMDFERAAILRDILGLKPVPGKQAA